MIQAILFDVDGVLVHPGRFRSWLEHEHGITPAMTAPFFKGPFVGCAEGKADLVDALPPFLKSWGWTGTATAFVDTWLSVENVPNHEALGVVAELLFFDDLRANVDGARAAGWSAELFTTVDALRSDVSKYTGLALEAGRQAGEQHGVRR